MDFCSRLFHAFYIVFLPFSWNGLLSLDYQSGFFFVPFSWCTKESMGLKIKLGLFYQNLSTDLTCPSASNRPELLRLRRRKRCRTKIELGWPRLMWWPRCQMRIWLFGRWRRQTRVVDRRRRPTRAYHYFTLKEEVLCYRSASNSQITNSDE